MRRSLVLGLAALWIAFLSSPAWTQDSKKDDDKKALEAELDKFREDLFHAFNKEDYKGMLEKYVHKDVIATWQDGTTSRGHQGVLDEFAKLKKFIAKMQVDPNTDERLILKDDKKLTVIASGNMKDVYDLNRGEKVALKSRWQATLVKDNDKWVLVSFSASTNAFENEVVDLYLKGTQYLWGASASAPA
jgi:hypothetical protein